MSTAPETAIQRTKYHHLTVCLVPSEETSGHVWDLLTRGRTQLKDVGLYRWPPHANILYPFVNPYELEGNSSNVDADVIARLGVACRQCESFTVHLTRMGTFGGAKRGVLWMKPESCREEPLAPLIELHAKLEEQFPECNDQRVIGSGNFTPHFTLSHFDNLDDALAAKAEIESWWPDDVTFEAEEVYLLARKGYDGQFVKLATLPLGEGKDAQVHCPPLRFEQMPREEADWIKEKRIKQKEKRKGWSRGRRGGSRNQSMTRKAPRLPDTPEIIAAKRAARKAKREAREMETTRTED